MLVEAGECNGFFDLKIFDQQQTVQLNPEFKQGINEIILDLDLPNTLFFDLQGKNHDCDTEVDDKGNIIRDKYLKVIEFLVDNKPVKSDKTKQMFILQSENNGEIHSSYWGFNGKVELDLTYESALDFHLSNLL